LLNQFQHIADTFIVGDSQPVAEKKDDEAEEEVSEEATEEVLEEKADKPKRGRKKAS